MGSLKSHPLEVGVVGCGIAGLSAAVALSRAGHTVEMFERSEFKNEVGAAILVGINATKILRSWGFDFEKAGALDATQMRRIKADTIEVDSEVFFGNVQEKYGDRWLFFHRADLHNGLRDLVEHTSPATRVRLATPVFDIDVDAGTMRTARGTTKKHLIIIADGSHSQLIPKIIGNDSFPVRKSPMSMYRFLQPMALILSDPLTSQFYKDRAPGFTTFYKTAVGRPGLLLNTYPCRASTLLYCALLHPTKPKERHLEGWSNPAAYEDVIADAAGFHPAVQEICKDAMDVKVYTQMWRDPLPNFSKGRAVLVGDAAHLMLPTHGQGASQAIEDALALEILFGGDNSTTSSTPKNSGVTAAEVPARLALFDKLRLPRVRAVQTLSNKMMGDLRKMVEEVKTYYVEGRDGEVKVPNATAKTFGGEFNDFFFCYDLRREAGRVLREGGL